MEKSFKEIIEEIKKENINEEEIKKYILSIKRVVKKAYESCKDEQEEAEILEEYLEDYNNDLKFRGKTQDIFNRMLMYNAYKNMIQDFKGNKISFDSVVREARKRESENNSATITLNTNIKEAMISAIRYIIRTRKTTKEKEILIALQEEKSKISKYLKDKMIDIMHGSVTLLNEYGFIDEYIAEANEELKQLGLAELQYEKRNPIADIQYDENGKVVKDVEDIGVIDTFARDNLEQLPLEDLIFMTTFWESKYLQERIGLSKAMSTVKTLNLWNTMLHEEDEKIENFNSSMLQGALKKDLALTYLVKNEATVTSRMDKQYKKFIEKEGIKESLNLNEEVKTLEPEISNLESAARDVAILECLILHQIRTKESKVKRWGVIDKSEIEDDIEENQGITFAIENKNFRGTLVMSLPKYLLKDFFGIEEAQLPKYDKELDNTYCDIMSKLYLPTNKYFTNLIQKAYKENPQSELLADLSGKKVQKQRDNER